MQGKAIPLICSRGFGIHESLPIRAVWECWPAIIETSDLGIPLIGVGLMYQRMFPSIS
jgi:hypothetical protein